MLVVGVLLAVLGGFAFAASPGGPLGYLLLGAAGICAQIGVIGIGVRLGMADHASPPLQTQTDRRRRPWDRGSQA